MTEVEKVEKDPDTGKRVKNKVGLVHRRSIKLSNLMDCDEFDQNCFCLV